MAKKFAEITGIHKIFKSETLNEEPNNGIECYTEMSITDRELQENIDENTIVFVTADNDDEGRIIGPNNYKISKDDCFIIAQNKVYATFGKVNVSDVMGPTGEDGVTPQLKIENDYWYISYDNGDTWTQLGKATGEDGKDGADGKDGQDGTSASMPVGSVIMFAGDEAPDGWLICDGRRIPVNNISDCNVSGDFYEYSELASIIKNIYGGSDTPEAATSITNFVSPIDEEAFEELFEDYSTAPCIIIPQFKGRFPYGSMSDLSLGKTGGNSSVTLTMANIPYHTHGVLIPDVNSSAGNNAGANDTDGNNFGSMTNYTTNSMDNYNSSKTTSPFSITPPFLYINFIIKYK